MQTLSTNQILFNASFSKDEFKKTYLAAIEAKFGKKQETIVSYPGGKLKMKKELNEIFTEMIKTNQFNTYIDGFFGMGGSFKALSNALLEHQVKEIIVNCPHASHLATLRIHTWPVYALAFGQLCALITWPLS